MTAIKTMAWREFDLALLMRHIALTEQENNPRILKESALIAECLTARRIPYLNAVNKPRHNE